MRHSAGDDPDLIVASLSIWVRGRQFEESQDYWDGNWLAVTARCEADQAWVQAAGPILHLSELKQFLRECQDLHSSLAGSAVLECMEPNIHAKLAPIGSLGEVEARISLTPDNLQQRHEFISQIDQSHLPFIIHGLTTLLKRFPLRGSPG